MADTPTKLVKYAYLDVVGFTNNRSVEAQTDIINILKDVAGRAIAKLNTSEAPIFLPTGDGLGIALLDSSLPYDAHIKLALFLLEGVAHHNSQMADPMRQFEIRIGANENVDNLVTDINGKTSVAGTGINNAQRVMNVAEASQIFVSDIVFQTLINRERYMKSFRQYKTFAKHGVEMSVYQFIDEGYVGLSTSVPKKFEKSEPSEKPLTKFEAYYLAHAIKNRDLFVMNSRRNPLVNETAATVMLWMLAHDSVTEEQSREYDLRVRHVYGDGALSPEELLSHYCSLDFQVCTALAQFIQLRLSSLERYMEQPRAPYVFLPLVNLVARSCKLISLRSGINFANLAQGQIRTTNRSSRVGPLQPADLKLQAPIMRDGGLALPQSSLRRLGIRSTMASMTSMALAA